MPTMTEPQRNLLWVQYDGPTNSQPRKPAFAVKQHVMRDFVERKSAVAARQMVVRRKSPLHRSQPRTRTAVKPPVLPHPAPALVCDKDRIVYRAAWWHRFAKPQTSDQGAALWKHRNKQEWNLEFWHAARMDETLLEVFICLATTKEAIVRNVQDTRAYYRHKGKAIALVSQDVNSKPK